MPLFTLREAFVGKIMHDIVDFIIIQAWKVDHVIHYHIMACWTLHSSLSRGNNGC